ncbi:CS1 type fimbrial major subunit [Aeromonas sp. R7-5]|uniref:CS1 type fimbrial major subunit n=1 Tax=Aeromonas sp. R7-5 TaxID=3138477 RepID=UPI0034A4F8D2
MIKQTILASALLAALVSTVQADPVALNFDVETTIQTSSFYVVPDGNWNSRPVVLNHDPIADVLRPASVNLRAKNTEGGINAYLDAPATLAQINGSGNIPLTIAVGGVELDVGAANATEVLSASDAAIEKGLSVDIMPVDSKGHVPGNYSGSVLMMFDASAS